MVSAKELFDWFVASPPKAFRLGTDRSVAEERKVSVQLLRDLAMRQQKPILVVLAAALIALSRLSSVAQVESPAPSPVRQIDHIMIRTDVPERLYAFFTETLQLPIAWPLAVRGTVASGAVGFGNVNVEVIKFPEQSRSQAQFVGFGFEPTPLVQCIVELKRRERV